VSKWFKRVIAVFLLPLCFGAARGLIKVLRATGDADTLWVALVAGAACWVVIYLLLPKPMLIYVFGHELTHAFWSWLFGGKLKRFKATARGGHVVVTKTNFLVALAPYFFPLYVAVVVGGFGLGHLIWGWTPYLAWFHFLVGAAYAFHVTLTVHVLKTQQSDITQQGYLFSAVIIWLGNVSVLLIGVPLLTTRVSVLTAVGWTFRETAEVFIGIGQWF
jgi:hypothetical protein